MFTMQRHLLFLLAASAAIVFAQPDAMDPPTRVARLNYVNGSVSFQPAGMDEWAAAVINRPLTTGDQLWVDQSSRAELHIGTAGIRLGQGTAFQILNLSDQSTQIQLTQGTMQVHVRFLEPDETFEVDTPGMAFSILRPGTYRVDAYPDDAVTVATVREGEGEVTAGQEAFTLEASQQAVARGTDQVSLDVQGAPQYDEFDEWCLTRVNRENVSVSRRYVNPEMIGYQDLDDNGSWREDASYGAVWYPRSVPAGWAPYHNGHWAWIDPWGWTWVDDASWGFAPFHYGRWAYGGNSWGWIPGPMSVRPVYAPALVAWVGGSHWGMSMSFGGGGGVGWIPLGPREVYVPSYHVSERYFTRVNNSNTVINNVNITNVYRTTVINRNVTNVNTVNYVNARAPNGVVAMPANAMASARPVNQFARPVSAQALAQAQVMHTATVVPQAAAVMGHGNISPNVARPPARALNTQVFARRAPPPPPPSFAARQAMLQRNPGQPVDAQSMQRMRVAAPAAQARPAVRVVTPAVGPAPAQRGRVMMTPQGGGRPAGAPGPAGGQYTRPGYGPPQREQVQPPAYEPQGQPQGQPQNVRPAYVPPVQQNAPQQPSPSRPGYNPELRQGRPQYGPPAGVRAPAPVQAAPAPAVVTPQPRPEVTRPSQPPAERRMERQDTRPMERAPQPEAVRPVQPPPQVVRPAQPPPEERRVERQDTRPMERAPQPEAVRPVQPPPQVVRPAQPPPEERRMERQDTRPMERAPQPEAARPVQPPPARTGPPPAARESHGAPQGRANAEKEKEKDKDKR
jgi:hypothetical protein